MYKPGDVVNDHILGKDNQWHPISQPTVEKPNLIGLNAYQAAQKAFSEGYSPHFYDGDTGQEYRASSPPMSFIVAREEYEDKKVRLYSPSTTTIDTSGNEEMLIQQGQSSPDRGGQQSDDSSQNNNSVDTPQVYGYTAPSALPLYAQPSGVVYSPPKIKASYGVTNLWLWLIVFVIPTLGFVIMYVNAYIVDFPLWIITAPLCAFFAYKDCRETDGGLLWLLAFFIPPLYLIIRRIQTGENQLPFLVATVIVVCGAVIGTITIPNI